jgi:hypothetical protein
VHYGISTTKSGAQRRAIANITQHELGGSRNSFAVAFAEVIVNNHIMASFNQLLRHHAANVARASGDQNSHQ